MIQYGYEDRFWYSFWDTNNTFGIYIVKKTVNSINEYNYLFSTKVDHKLTKSIRQRSTLVENC
jgi:hypothetical protein